MSGHVDVLGSVAIVITVVMVGLWLLSLWRRDVSIVDIGWGAGIVVASWVAWGVGDGNADRSNLLIAMVTIWGVRLTVHLARRHRGRGEDPRYAALRRHRPNFAVTSLFTVFGFQAIAMFLVILPIQLAVTPADPSVGLLGVLGAVVWGLGFFFEVVADAQLTRFRAHADNAGGVLDQGLWRYSRHPNYFGDALIWWGIWLVAAESGDAAWAVGAPALMTFLLIRVTGVPPLEHGLVKRHDDYPAYVARTSAFLPRPPKVETDA